MFAVTLHNHSLRLFNPLQSQTVQTQIRLRKTRRLTTVYTDFMKFTANSMKRYTRRSQPDEWTYPITYNR